MFLKVSLIRFPTILFSPLTKLGNSSPARQACWCMTLIKHELSVSYFVILPLKNVTGLYKKMYSVFWLLLLLLSPFSRVRLCAAAHQAPPSLGFSRQEHWSGLPFPSPMHENENESEVA